MRILWAPERVGEGRRFRIVVEAEVPLACECSDLFALLDRTPPDSSGREHRFYFCVGRAASPGGEIRFRAGNATETVRMRVVPEAEWGAPAMLGAIQLPRIWPLDGRAIGLKSRHTYVDPTDIGQSAACGATPECEALGWSDDQVWDLVAPCDIPRWHFLNLDFGCPVHGLDIYHSDPYYPWIVDVLGHPYQVQCPVGGEWYPTNDYAAGDHTSGEFPDDGFGWEPREDGPRKDAKFGFISYYLLRRIRFAYATTRSLADYFLATGDTGAARKLAILLASIAREHRYLCCFPEHRFRRYEITVEEPAYREGHVVPAPFGPSPAAEPAHLARSGMDDYCINMPFHYVEITRAYDMIFDRIGGDAELVAFLGRKLGVADGDGVRRFIETHLFRAGAQVGLDDAMASNLPEPQRGLISLIRVLDQPECRELADWLLYGLGDVARLPANFYYKDGAAYESTGGYNGHHVCALVPIVDGLKTLRSLSPEAYPADRFDPIEGHERYHHILRWPLEIIIAQLDHPLIGDTGSLPNAKRLARTPIMPMSALMETYESAARSFPDDPYIAAALAMLRRIDELRRQAVERGEKGTAGFYGGPHEAQVEPDPLLFWPSRLLDGYGVGILESGEGDARRGVWLYYGDHPGHSHEERLDIGLFAHRRNLLRHMGYPYSWQFMDTWDANWITHYSLKIVGKEQPAWRSTVRLFHGARPNGGHGPFQIVQAAGYGVGTRDEDGVEVLDGYRQRRAICLVDLPDGRFYVADFSSATGGTDHWWSFHGVPGPMSFAASASLAEQPTGTAAGPNVAYGETPPEPVPRSLSHLYHVRRAPTLAGAPSPHWHATWKPTDGEGIKLRATQVAPVEGELILARGRSPHAPEKNPPYELDWVLRHRTGGTSLASEFITIIEADEAPPVDAAEPLLGEGASGIKATIGEVSHWILRADDVVPLQAFGDVQFAGRAGFVETDAAGIRSLTLVGDGMLTWRGRGIVSGARDWRGSIIETDTAANRIVVEADGPPPAGIIGSYLTIHRAFDGVADRDSFAYRVEAIAAAGPDRWECRLNWSPVIADGTVAAHTATGFAAPGLMPMAAMRAYYHGAYLLNGDRSIRVRVADIQGSYSVSGGYPTTIIVAPEFRLSMAAAFPVGSRFVVEEIGVDDRTEVPGWVEVRRSADGSWEVSASGPAAATGP